MGAGWRPSPTRCTEHGGGGRPLPPPPPRPHDTPAGTRRATHRIVRQVTDDIERFHFNKAVAGVYELANVVGAFRGDDEGAGWALREALETLTLLIGPMMPHLAEELWRQLGRDGLVAETAWPEAEAALLVEATARIAIQLNGKLRATLELPRDLPEADMREAAMADDRVRKAIGDRPVRRVVVVPNRIVNIVA